MAQQLIIVCEKQYLQYATYLQGLVSRNDDEKDKQVGTKDGSVKAVIWDEAHHKANAKTTNSTNRIVFFGNSKYVKKNCAQIEVKKSEIGMFYGWLGNHANLYVENDSLNKDNVDRFYELANQYGQRFEEELSLLYSPSKDQELGNGSADHALAAAELLFPPAHIADLVINKGQRSKFSDRFSMVIGKGSDFFKSGKAKDQQYTLLTLMFYMDGLSEFMGA